MSLPESARTAVEGWPWLFLQGARRRRGRNRVVAMRGRTGLLVEGYPRSGNTFLVAWIARCNPAMEVASHVHSIAHVRYAVRHRIPTAVVVREPQGCVSSHLVMYPDLDAGTLLRRYIRFHQGLVPHLDDIVIAPFERTTNDPPSVVCEINQRFGVSLEVGEMSANAEEQTFAAIDALARARYGSVPPEAVSRPAVERADARGRAAEALNDPSNGALLDEARAIFERVAKRR